MCVRFSAVLDIVFQVLTKWKTFNILPTLRGDDAAKTQISEPRRDTLSSNHLIHLHLFESTRRVELLLNGKYPAKPLVKNKLCRRDSVRHLVFSSCLRVGVSIFPCWFQRESITIGDVFFPPRGLRQMEVILLEQ